MKTESKKSVVRANPLNPTQALRKERTGRRSVKNLAGWFTLACLVLPLCAQTKNEGWLVIQTACVRCHGPKQRVSTLPQAMGTGKFLPGGLDLSTEAGACKGGDHGPAITPKPADSLIWKAVTSAEGVVAMPPFYQLTKAQVDAVEAWLKKVRCVK